MTPIISVPAYCPTCHSLFPSGIALGQGAANVRMTNNVSGPCPNGHMGLVMDGTFDVIDGALHIKESGRVTAEVLARIRQLAEDAKGGHNRTKQGVGGGYRPPAVRDGDVPLDVEKRKPASLA